MITIIDLTTELKDISKQQEITGLDKYRIGEIAREIETIMGYVYCRNIKNDYSN